MPDISMCQGGDCPNKTTCYRATAVPSEYLQSYFTILPVNEEGICDYYIPTEKNKDETK